MLFLDDSTGVSKRIFLELLLALLEARVGVEAAVVASTTTSSDSSRLAALRLRVRGVRGGVAASVVGGSAVDDDSSTVVVLDDDVPATTFCFLSDFGVFGVILQSINR